MGLMEGGEGEEGGKAVGDPEGKVKGELVGGVMEVEESEGKETAWGLEVV